MSLADRIVRGLKATLAAQVVHTVSNAALVLLLTRYLLTPEGYGRLNFALSTLAVVAIFGTLGLPKSVARYVTEFSETDPGQIPHLLARSLAYLLGLLAIVGVVLAVSSRHLADFLGDPALAPFLLLGVAHVACRGTATYLRLVFQGFNRVDYSALLRSISSVSRLAFAVALVLLGFGALGALGGYVAGFAIAVAVGLTLLYARFYSDIQPAERVTDGLSRRLLEYSVPLTATRGANVLDRRVDMVLVGTLLNTTAVGYYALAKQIGQFASVPAASLGFTISPAVGEQSAGDRRDRAARLYEESLEFVLLLYLPAALGLALVAAPLVRHVFGTDFLPAVPVVQTFGAYVLVNAVNKITADGLDYLGRARSRAIAKGAMAVANFLLNLALIPVMGVVGAAVATVATYTVYTGLNVYVIHDELSLRLDHIGRRLAGVTGVSVGMAAAVVAAIPHVSGVVTLGGVVALGVVVWAALAIGTGLLDVRRIVSLLA